MKCENKTDFNGSEIVIEWSNDSKGGGRGGRGGRVRATPIMCYHGYQLFVCMYREVGSEGVVVEGDTMMMMGTEVVAGIMAVSCLVKCVAVI